MSTDKTQADVQPGGRVRLGDQAERAQFEAWAKSQNYDMHQSAGGPTFVVGEYTSELTAGAWEAWQHLSAQPSPGGQGEVCIPLPTPGNGEWSDGWNACRDAMLRGEGEALAARQPVYVQGSDELRARTEGERAAYMEGLEEGKKIAARQPVEFERAIPTRRRESAVELLLQLGFVWNNQRWEDRRQPVGEPVDDAGRSAAYDAIDRFLRNNMDDEAYAAYVEHLEALWAAVPAQAVDLGGLREILESWKNSDYPFSYEGQCAQRALDACIADLKGWLDSQAVGK